MSKKKKRIPAAQPTESKGNPVVDHLQQIAESEGMTHLQRVVAGLDKKAAEHLAKAQQAASYGASAYGTAKSLQNQTSNQQEIEGIKSAVDSPSGLSQNSTIGGRKVSNAKAIAEHTVFGVNHLAEITLVVEGRKVSHYKNFSLEQTIKGHHFFTVALSHDALGVEETYQMEQVQDLLGKRIFVTFNLKGLKEKPERHFTGIITAVSFEQAHGSRGYIVLNGSSPTILLDAAPHIQSFGGSSPIPLNSIVNQIVEEGYTQGGKYNFQIKSSNNYTLSYSSIFNETPYNYLARMAEAYGEQFFYDGDILYFGDLPKGEDPIKLVYGREVDNLTTTLKVRHVNRQLYGYNSLNNEKLSASGDTKLAVKGTLAKVAYQKSERTFTAPSLQMAPIKASTTADITQAQKGVIGSEGLNSFVTTGTTTVPFLYPGCVIRLEVIKPGSKESTHFTTLMITAITHRVDALGTYEGHFCAVDADTGFIPRITYTNPVVEQQVGTVINNTDPQNKGRVQVQFDWQNGDQRTAFIRVMTPDAGSSDQVGTNRGFVAIPEVGDQVMVDFVSGHPDRPYVMGGLFHGQSGAGGGIGNNIKSLSSKSGHIVELNDGGGITIRDKDQNSICLSGDGHITSTSKESISMICGASSFYMDKEGNIELNGKDISTSGVNIETLASTQITMGVGNKDAEPSTGFTAHAASFDFKTPRMKMNAGLLFNLTSLNIGIEAEAETVIKGGKVKLN